MFKYSILTLLILFMTGCVTAMTLEEQTPELDYANNEKILISIIDERKRVKEGKPKNYIGKAHGSFGIPADWHVKQVLATEDGDEERDLAGWLQHRIVRGLNEEGWQSEEIDFDSLPNAGETATKLEERNSTWLLAMVLNEWYFSINLNWVTAFNFDSDVNVHLFNIEGGEVLSKKFKERDVIDEKAGESPQNNVLNAYKAQIQQILNDDEIRGHIEKG